MTDSLHVWAHDSQIREQHGEVEGAPSNEQAQGGDDENQDRDEEQYDYKSSKECPVLVDALYSVQSNLTYYESYGRTKLYPT